MKLRFFLALVFITPSLQAAQHLEISDDDWVDDFIESQQSPAHKSPLSPQPISTVTELVTMPPRPVTPPLTSAPTQIMLPTLPIITPPQPPNPLLLIHQPLLPPKPRSDDPIMPQSQSTDSFGEVAPTPPLAPATTNRFSPRSPIPTLTTPLSPQKRSMNNDLATTNNSGWFSRCCGCLCVMRHSPKKGS